MPPRLRRVVCLAVAAVIAGVVFADAGSARAGEERRERLAEGVEHLVVAQGQARAHVAVVEPDAPFELRAVVGGDHVGAGLERTSAMCRRVGCVVAVNGDFRQPGTTAPVGGVVRDGVVLKSGNESHHQLLVGRDGRLAAGQIQLQGKVVSTDLEEIPLHAVNVERTEDRLVLFTPAFGSSTGTNQHGVEVSVRFVDPGPVVLGETRVVEVIDTVVGGDASIPEDGAVLSGHGREAARLADLQARMADGRAGARLLLRVEAAPDAWQSVGGTPILLRDGQPWFGDAATDFVRGRHPRTAVGWNEEGQTWLVAVDGRQPGHSEGMTLAELADFMLGLGATEALNLDGGGTTTFVVGGDVVNRPSDRLVRTAGRERVVPVPGGTGTVVGTVERPATTALAVVPLGQTAPSSVPIDRSHLDLPAVESPLPTVPDPASVPGGNVPALVAVAPTAPLDPWPVSAAALAVGAVAAGLAAVRHRARGAQVVRPLPVRAPTHRRSG